jgi:hypothetical protein
MPGVDWHEQVKIWHLLTQFKAKCSGLSYKELPADHGTTTHQHSVTCPDCRAAMKELSATEARHGS